MLGKNGEREAENDLYANVERPYEVIDYSLDATDYEVVDIFNWQEETARNYTTRLSALRI